MAKIKEDARPLGSPRSWAKTPGTLIAGQAAIDGADVVALVMEERWGAGRLRLLVDEKLREKFDRQRFLFNAAIWHGDLETVRREAERMVKAWRALDEAAVALHAPFLSPDVWEATLEDGTVVALVRSQEEARVVTAMGSGGRQMVVYTVAEIAHMLSVYQEVTKVKDVIPGATVEHMRRICDPLDGIRDGAGLDDTIDDVLAFQ